MKSIFLSVNAYFYKQNFYGLLIELDFLLHHKTYKSQFYNDNQCNKAWNQVNSLVVKNTILRMLKICGKILKAYLIKRPS